VFIVKNVSIRQYGYSLATAFGLGRDPDLGGEWDDKM
jgi:hypothetical protein